MDRGLAERLNNLSAQNEILRVAREAYLLKESERKHFEAVLIREAAGKSHAEKVVNAQASDGWVRFSRALAKLESRYEFEKLKFDILDKAYLAEHASFKVDGNMIRRQL